MRYIALITDDFKVSHDVIEELKRRDAPFKILSFDDPIPMEASVVITTQNEIQKIDYHRVILFEQNAAFTVRCAMLGLRNEGDICFRELVVGIDPGDKPGIAVVANGEVLETAKAASPEDVQGKLENILIAYPTGIRRLRIGHGDRMNRNRIIHAIDWMFDRIEVVDETHTTNSKTRPDIEAAKQIALTGGILQDPNIEAEPTDGKLRDIQRRSRIASAGKLTISRECARRVALGELSIDEAVAEMDCEGA